MLGVIDKKRDFLVALHQSGGIISSTIALATAKALVKSSSDPNLK